MKPDLEEIFVEFKLQKLVGLDHKSAIKTMINKYRNGEVFIPTQFKVIGVDVESRGDQSSKLFITIAPTDNFSLDSLTDNRKNDE